MSRAGSIELFESDRPRAGAARLTSRTNLPDRKQEELELQGNVLRYLALHPKMAWVGRFNRGAALRINQKTGRRSFVRFCSVPGFSDIAGQLRTGRFVACECKAGDGQLSDEQRNFLAHAAAHGALAFVARSLSDVESALRDA